MPTQQYKRYEQILQGMINATVSRSDLSDMTDASGAKHILAAPAREIDEFYYQLALVPDRFSIDSAQGDDLDDRAAEIQPALIFRRQAAKSTGQVTFSRSGTSGIVTIPIGTVVKTADGIEFVTTAVGTIPDLSSTSGAVTAIAVEAGAAGDVDPTTIVRFDAKPAGVDTVTNAASFSGGEDKESDDAFRARLKAFIRTLARCTPEALEFIAASVQLENGERVVYAHAYEDPVYRGEVTVYIDNGSGTAETVEVVAAEAVVVGALGGEQFVRLDEYPVKRSAGFTITSSLGGVLVEETDFYLDEASGWLYFPAGLTAGEDIDADYTAFTGLIAEVQKVIDGDPLDRVNYPGWRAAGVRVRVLTPQILQQVVEAGIVLLEGYSSGTVLPAVAAAISEYVNGLGISGDVIRNELIERMMEVPGVYNLSLLEPLTDTIILDDQLPRVTSGNIILS